MPVTAAGKIVTVLYIILSLGVITAIVMRHLGYALETFAKSLASAGGPKEGQRLVLQLMVPVAILVAVFIGGALFLGLANETGLLPLFYNSITFFLICCCSFETVKELSMQFMPQL